MPNKNYRVAAASMGFSGTMGNLQKCRQSNRCTKADVGCLAAACKAQIVRVAKGYLKRVSQYAEKSKNDMEWADAALANGKIDKKDHARRIKEAQGSLARLAEMHDTCSAIAKGDMSKASGISLDFRGRMPR